LFGWTHHRGADAGLSTYTNPEHPFCEVNDHQPRSGLLAFSVARPCASFGLAAYPRTQRQGASKSVSTTDVSRHEHP
jgi:hypothetical protein